MQVRSYPGHLPSVSPPADGPTAPPYPARAEPGRGSSLAEAAVPDTQAHPDEAGHDSGHDEDALFPGRGVHLDDQPDGERGHAEDGREQMLFDDEAERERQAAG